MAKQERNNNDIHKTQEGPLWDTTIHTIFLESIVYTLVECVVNKEIKGRQCTITWQRDDIKKSHVEKKVMEQIT